MNEQAPVAQLFKNKSVAEQNSIDIAWSLLMDDKYSDLRAAIYTTNAELRRFRQLVINSVMASDIVDKELKALRNLRWDRAFSEHNNSGVNSREDKNRKATSEYLCIVVVLLAAAYRMRGQRFLTMFLVVF